MKTHLLIALVLLAGCSPSSLEDFQQEGEARCRRLINLLQNVHNQEELLQSEAALKQEFNRLVDLIIEARTFQLKHEDVGAGGARSDEVSESLKEQMLRIYRIEGGREIVERAERDSLLRLDAFEKKVRSGGLL